MNHRSGPLLGVRVVEMAGIGPAPFACMMLSDMGCEVIRVARPGSGAPDPRDIILRGRKTVEADLKNPTEIEKLLRLMATADVLVEGFRPGVMERAGLGPDQLHQRNPRLVYGRMTGWGQHGPRAQLAGHDINYISVTGALAAIGPAEHPSVPLNLVGDYGGGALYLVVGVLAALLEARSSGCGQVVDAAMCDGVVSLTTLFHQLGALGRWTAQRESNRLDGGAPFYGTYACKDGRFIAIGPLEAQFFGELLGRLGLRADDGEFAGRDAAENWPAMRRRLQELFATHTQAHWVSVFEGSDACVTPVLSFTEAQDDPHLQARGAFLRQGDALQPAPAPRFSRTPSAIQPQEDGRSVWAIEDFL